MPTRREFCILMGAAIPASCGSSGAPSRAAASDVPPTVFPRTDPPVFAGNGKLLGSFDWRRAPIPAGGFVIGMDFSSDGKRMLHWADVFNGYIREAGDREWRLLLRRDNLPATEYDPRPRTPTTDSGVFAARIAPSDRDVIYASWNGFVFRSGNGGASFARTALPGKKMQSNLGPQRRFNRALDVHRRDPDQVIVGTNNDGVHATRDGGKTWSAVPLPPAEPTGGQPGKYLVGFGPDELVYVHVPGHGVWRSTSGVSGAYEHIGGPLTASCLVITQSGTVYVCEYRTGPNTANDALKRFDGKAWTGLACPADQVAVDPRDERHLFAVGENLVGKWPVIRRSFDGGETWTSYRFTRGQGEVAWLSNRDKASFPAQIMFDPVEPYKLWMADGVGISWSILPRRQRAGIAQVWQDDLWTLHDHSNGNAELVPTITVSSPGNPAILCFWDKPFWRLEHDREPLNMWSYPVPPGKTFSEGTVTVGYGVDYASDDPAFLVAVAGQGNAMNGYSTDGGRSWTQFASQPPAPYRFGGSLAVSTRDNFVLLSSNNGGGVYTLDGGQTWLPVRLDGAVQTLDWNNAYYVNRMNITADKTRKGVFAAVYRNVSKGPTGRDVIGHPLSGLWLSTDGGATWTRRLAGTVHGPTGGREQFWQCRLRYVPGFTGELLYADGTDNPGNPLVWSRDDGASWREVSPAIRKVNSFGFGKAAPGRSRPAVYFAGTVRGTKGIYATFDWFESDPVLLTRSPLETISGIGDVTGDLNIFGRCYAMITGNGAALCDYRRPAAGG